LVGALAKIKSYLDYGMFTPIQVAAIEALEGDQTCVRCSFSIKPKRTYLSPYSPKPIPGETPTFATAMRFTPIQVAAIEALEGDQTCVKEIAQMYQDSSVVGLDG
jgi:aspartate/methionine/tyrosine aminotransferase